MVILALSIVLVSLAVVVFTAIRISRTAGRRHVELTPSLIFFLAFFAYALGMPFSRIVLRSEESPVDVPYMIEVTSIAACMAAGVLVAVAAGQFRRKTHDCNSAEERTPNWIAALSLSVIATFLCVVTWAANVNFDYGALLSSYGASEKAYEAQSAFDTAVIVSAIAANWLASSCAATEAYRRRKILLLLPTLILCLFFILRGNRNSAMIQVLPIACHWLRRRALRWPTLLASGLVLYAALYSIAVIRAYGFGHIDSVHVTSRAFDPLSGELGTLYGVYEKTTANSIYDSDLWYGRSYVVDSVVNLVPRDIWPDRPLTVAQIASVQHYGGRELKLGIGFSPIVEAQANFGVMGGAVFFGLLPVLIGIAEKALDKRSTSVPYHGVLAPMLVNFWRIDFATCVKMTLLFGLTLLLCGAVARMPKRQNVRVRNVRVVVAA